MEETTLDTQQRKDGRNLLHSVITDTGRYMAAGIQYANRKAGVTDRDFWEGLFVPTGSRESDVILRANRNADPAKCPEDPYGELDIQACNKYLLYGGGRTVTRNGAAVKLTDSSNFFRTFRIDQKAYRYTLIRAIDLRNASAHSGTDWEKNLTADTVYNGLRILQDLTEPLQRSREPWRGEREPLADYWKRQNQKCRALLGAAPIRLEDVGQELFMCDTLTAPQMDALDQAVEWYNLDCRNGKIYREERRLLKEKLRAAPSLVRLLGEAPRPAQTPAAPAAPAAETEKQAAPVSFEPPINTAAAALLKRAGGTVPLLKNYVSALLDSFVPLVDESVFLSIDGQAMLANVLAPRLMERHEQLLVDESVVTALFRRFRSSAAYTEMELAELPAKEREAAQKWRQEIHRTSKTAVKVLRDLRKRRCLQVVASPTDSEHSCDNLLEVARMTPGVRFLVLTMERDLAEELTGLPQRNAVAAKPNIDSELLLFRATRQTYLSMLDNARTTEAPAVQARRQPPARPAAPMPRSTGAAVSGGRLLAVGPDGAERRCTLGKSLGEGGEGTIYVTAEPDVVAKVYFDHQRTRERMEKLQAMLRSDPHIPGLCWPTAMLYAGDGAWVGYLMPKAQGKELARTVFHPGRNNIVLTKQGWTRRSLAEIAANVAAVFARIHAQGILMGDVNPRNFLVTQDCAVSLVDCDSYQFGGYRCPVGTPLYTPPEVHRQMRTEDREDYGYERTVENERYSLAVLLFEILMLGKPPYESRNTNNADVVQAIIAGDFPYPYHSDDEDQKAASRGLQAPVGRWRQIWSHMTYQVKTDFYNTFTNRKRLTAQEWEKSMREYARMIELGRSSDELMPNGYKVVTGVDDATVMVNRVCEDCGQPYNIAKDLYERRKANGEKDLCSTHRDIQMNLRGRSVMVACSRCGQNFEMNAAKWIELDNSGKPLLCSDCFNGQFTTVTCSQCGRSYKMKTERWNELCASGKPALCGDCLNANRTTVRCSRCGKQFQMWNETLQRRRQYGDSILCPDCKNYRR